MQNANFINDMDGCPMDSSVKRIIAGEKWMDADWRMVDTDESWMDADWIMFVADVFLMDAVLTMLVAGRCSIPAEGIVQNESERCIEKECCNNSCGHWRNCCCNKTCPKDLHVTGI